MAQDAGAAGEKCLSWRIAKYVPFLISSHPGDPVSPPEVATKIEMDTSKSFLY